MALILVVDDRAVNRDYMVTLLGYRDHRVIEASDGQEGLAVARRARPDLIISDILMPTMDGYEFVRAVRSDPLLQHTPVIFTTAHYLDREVQGLAAACGVPFILHKPHEPEAVLDTVAEALGLARHAAAAAPPLPDDGAFDREHLRVVSDKLTLTVQDLRTANDRLTALLDFGLRLGSELDPQRLLHSACDAARSLIGAKYTIVGVLANDGETVAEWITGGMDRARAGHWEAPWHPGGVLGDTLKTRQVRRWSAPAEDAEPLGLPSRFPPVHSLLAVPIASPTRLYGCLCLIDKLGLSAFTDEDEQLAVTLAAQAGRVYENSQLYGEISRYAASLETALAEQRSSEARYRSIVETAVDAMIVIDETGTIQSFNPAAERIFGYAAPDMVGQNVRLLMPEPDRSRHDGYLGHYRATGERRIIGIGREVTGRRRDGSVFPLDLSIAEWQADERRFFTGIMRDITQRQSAESDLRQAKEVAERASLSKTRFLAAASHDLRQPLQSLFFFAETVRRHIPDAHGREMLGYLQEGLDVLKGLLDSLLDVSRLDSGTVKPEIESFPLADLLDHLAVAYAPVAAGKGLSLDVPPCSASVRSDRVLLGRMLRNLIENAVRYTDRGHVRIDSRPQGDRLVIEISDTGIGIPPEHLALIWDEFHQVGNPERDRALGLGLGLAIVRRLATLTGHTVAVRSTPGEGTVFTIDVPLVPTAELPAPPAPGPALAQATPEAPGLFVVLVDDDDIVLKGLELMLAGWGYAVLTASSTDQALDRLRGGTRRPDLLVVDYRLREGRVGTEAALKIREMFTAAIPGIILTGEIGPEAQHDAAVHRLGLLHKPVMPRQLDAELQRQMAAAGDAGAR